MDGISLHALEEVQQIAEEYASYAQSKGGLANVLGGLVGIIIYLLNGLLGRSGWTTLLTIVLTLLWLVGKEVIRARLYRPFGEAHERWSTERRRVRTWTLSIFYLASGILWFGFVNGYFRGKISLIQLLVGLLIATFMPALAWRFFYNIDEIMVGMFLLISCALVSVGSLLGEGLQAWMAAAWMPVYALMLLLRGLEEHRRFRELAQRLQQARGALS